MRKFAAAALAAALCLSSASAQALTVTGLETETVDRQWETSLFFERMQQITGVAVQAHGVSDAQAYDEMIAAMAAGDVPADVLFKANLSREQERTLLDAGAIIDLAPLIDANMPNLSALLVENPEWGRTIALEDGRIASLPLINRAERQVCMWINASWLSALGIPMPTTLEELTQALIAMRDGDPNGNGKADEIAADLTGVYEMRWLLPYFGIVADDYNLARSTAGEIVFAPELPAYRSFIALLCDWVESGVLPADAFTAMHAAEALLGTEEEEAVTSGLLLSTTPYTAVSVEATADYQALLLAGPDGVMRWRDLLGEIWTGCFAVTSACENPAQALAWVDALYAPEGAILAYAGVEGEDYAYNAQGRWAFQTDGARSINAIRAQVLMYTGAAMPGLYPDAFLAQVDSAIDVHVMEQSERVRAVSERVLPAYALSEAEQARADELAAAIGGLVDRGIARFATGEWALTDENYAAWLAQLREAGSEELTQLAQNALED